MDDTKKHEIAGVSPPPPFEDVRVEMESYQPSYTRLSATGRAAFDAYDGPVNCGPPGRMNFDQGRRREMDAELKDRARALVERWFPAPGGEPEWSKAVMVDDLTTLLAEVRAETEAQVVEAAAQVAARVARTNSKLSREMEDHDLLAASNRHRAIAIAVRKVEAQIRALAPADYVAVRREGFEVIAEAAEELEARIRMERAGYESSRADEIRAALSRARKGE